MWIWITLWGHLLSALRSSVSVSYNVGPLSTNSLSFDLPGNVFILPSFLKRNFCQLYLFAGIFLDALCICHSTAFWPPIVLVLAYMWWVAVLLLLSWLFVGLGYNNLTMIWQDVDLSVFINWGSCWTQMCRVTLLKNQIWKFMAIICSNNLSVSSFLPVRFPVGRCCCAWSFKVQVSEALYI